MGLVIDKVAFGFGSSPVPSYPYKFTDVSTFHTHKLSHGRHYLVSAFDSVFIKGYSK